MARTDMVALIGGLLLSGCATPPPPPNAVPTVGEQNKIFWFRDLRAIPTGEGLAVSGFVIRKRGGFWPIPGILHIEALTDNAVIEAADVRWRRINWRARSSGKFGVLLSGRARQAEVVRISYRAPTTE